MRETDSERSASASDAHAQGQSPGARPSISVDSPSASGGPPTGSGGPSAGAGGPSEGAGGPVTESAASPSGAPGSAGTPAPDDAPGVAPADPVGQRMEDGLPHPVTAAARAGYLGFVAHEMRNPLSTALWSAELLGRLSVEDRGGARGEKLSGMCLRTLTRLRVLLEDYFLIERLGVGGLPIKREPVSLGSVIEQACGRVEGQFDVPPLPDVTIRADRSLLDRMMESVLAIAARESPVKIDVGVQGGAVEIRVAGNPAAPNSLEIPSKGTPSDSTGRALAVLVARAVAAAHSGELRLEEGAYVIALPLTEPEPGTQP